MNGEARERAKKMDAAGAAEQWQDEQGKLNEQQAKRFVQLAVGNQVFTLASSGWRCGYCCRRIGRFHKLVCWWWRFWA